MLGHNISRRLVRLSLVSVSPLALAFGLVPVGARPAAAADACTLASPTTWADGSSDWFTAGNWNPAAVPNGSSTNVCIVDGASAVSVNGSPSVASLQIGAGNSISVGGTLFVYGPSLINAGTIAVPNTTFQLGGNVSLSGGGSVQMSGNAFLNQASGGLTLHNVDNTIQGTGQLGQNGLALDNQSGGTVNANVNGGTLTLNAGGAVTNAGLLEATNGGTLQISNNVNNAGGVIEAVGGAPGGTVSISATITGGTLTQAGSGILQTNGAAVLSGVTLSSGSSYAALGTTGITGTITNNGVFAVPNTTLQVTGGDATLQGGGVVQLSQSAFLNQASGGLTLHNLDNTIQGTGQVGQNGLTIDNQSGGTINANVSAGTLTLNGGGVVTNAGLLEATNGGTLQITNTVNNTSNITADGGTVNINATINGGTLNTKNSGVMNGPAAVLNGVTLSTGSTFTASGTTQIEGTITNNGTFAVPNEFLQVVGGDATLQGGGVVLLSQDAFLNQASGGLTLHNVDNTIQGTGQVGQNGLALDNKSGGTVNANVSAGTLTLNGGGAVTNAGLLEATNGGTLQINNNVNNTSDITADGGTISISATINGGRLNTKNGGLLNGASAVLNGVTVSTGSTFTVTGTTQIEGTITNNGAFAVPNSTLQVVGGDATLKGGGTVQMSSDGFLNQASGGLTLHNFDNTIQGTGQVGQNGLALDNQSGGTVNANVSGGTLFLNGGGTVANAGLLEATSGGTLQINNTINNTADITADGGTVNVIATINGGTLNTKNGGLMNGPSAVLNGVTLSSGSTFTVTGTTQLEGAITNKGTFAVPNNTLQVLGGDVTLKGGGVVQMSSNAFFNQASGGLTLHNADNTIEGTGQVGQNGLALDNQSGGTILANVSGGTLFLNGGGSVTNQGTFQVDAGSKLVVIGDGNGLRQTQGTSGMPLILVDGELDALNGIQLEAGVLKGSGTVVGNVNDISGAVAPGDSPGILTVVGNYTQGSGGAFDVYLAGLTAGVDYSQLDVTGSAALDGLIDVIKAPGFALEVGYIFTIMEFASSTGDFAAFSYNGGACSAGVNDLWTCAAGVQFQEQFIGGDLLNLIVTDAGVIPPPAVPELSTWAMMLAGFGGVGLLAWRGRRLSAQA